MPTTNWSSSRCQGKRLGNMVVWFGLVTGVPFIALLYSLEYCRKAPGNCAHP